MRIKQAGQILGQKGGVARAKALAPETRHDIAKKAALTRWATSNAKSDRINSLFNQLVRNAEYIRNSADFLQAAGDSCHGEAIRFLRQEAKRRYGRMIIYAERHGIEITAKVKTWNETS